MRRHKKWTIPLLAVMALAVIASITLLLGARVEGSAGAASTSSIAAGSGLGASAETPVPTAAQTALPTVEASADFATLYSSIDQLKQAADLIVTGEVVSVSYLDFNSTAYSKVDFKIEKCLRGNAASGDNINIAEVGGITTMATIAGDKFGPATGQDMTSKVEVQLDGAPLSQVGDQCTYFLGTGSIGVLPDTYYVPLGAFQGRFKIDNGIAARYVPADWQSPRYSALPMTDSALDQAVLVPATE